jgi:hypothetical protein
MNAECRNIEHRTSNIQCRTLNLERPDRGYGHPEATLKLPSGHMVANR